MSRLSEANMTRLAASPHFNTPPRDRRRPTHHPVRRLRRRLYEFPRDSIDHQPTIRRQLHKRKQRLRVRPHSAGPEVAGRVDAQIRNARNMLQAVDVQMPKQRQRHRPSRVQPTTPIHNVQNLLLLGRKRLPRLSKAQRLMRDQHDRFPTVRQGLFKPNELLGVGPIVGCVIGEVVSVGVRDQVAILFEVVEIEDDEAIVAVVVGSVSGLHPNSGDRNFFSDLVHVVVAQHVDGRDLDGSVGVEQLVTVQVRIAEITTLDHKAEVRPSVDGLDEGMGARHRIGREAVVKVGDIRELERLAWGREQGQRNIQLREEAYCAELQ